MRRCDECAGKGGIENYERDGSDVIDKCESCNGTGMDPSSRWQENYVPSE